MQEVWRARKAEEIQACADRNEWKQFFAVIKAVYGSTAKGAVPLLSADRTTLLSDPSDSGGDRRRSRLSAPPPRNRRDREAVKRPDRTQSLQRSTSTASPKLMNRLTTLLQEMRRRGQVPKDFKDTTIVHLYKRKEKCQPCDNRRGISPLNIAGKIFARVRLNRLNSHLEQGPLLKSQYGRRLGTIDTVFAVCQLRGKCQEMRTHLYSTFVDPMKAFDPLNREGLWKMVQKSACLERFPQLTR
ncbi:hypothetical protein SprV_0100106600 [Sparganum proliferum]